MKNPANYPGRLSCPALQLSAMLLFSVISMTSITKPAQASGTVSPSAVTYFGGGPSASCYSLASPGAVKSCTLNYSTQQLNESVNNLNSIAAIANRPISCPLPVLTELGNIYEGQRTIGGYVVDAFSITYYVPGVVGYFGGAPGGNAYCGDPNVATYVIIAWQAPLSCPAHSTGTPATSCICTDNYVPDSARTSCILEQYSIALSGLGGEVMPNRTRDAYAQVTKGDGTPKSGAQVFLAYDFAPEEDGYNHAVGQHTAPHRGSLSTTGGTTGADGRLSFVFQAPEAGGTHYVAAGCTNCTNTTSGTIRVPGCPVPPLTPLPEADACTAVLENYNSTRAQKDAACGVLADNLKTGMACFREKLSGLAPAIPMIVSSDIRSVAYQAHLREVWDNMKRVINWMDDNPTIQAVCAARRAELAAEKGCDKADACKSEPNEVCYPESSTQRSHCLVARPANPSPNDAQHTQGEAFDVSKEYTITPLLGVLGVRAPRQNIQQFLNAPTFAYPNGCNLSWGGMFSDNYDPVHFYVP